MGSPPLAALLARELVEVGAPGREPCRAVGGRGLDLLVQALGLDLRRAMVACLDEGIWPQRLVRNRGTLGAAEQRRLLEAKVAVLGCGGLGGQVILQLARLGVGRLALCDGDVFEESNLNRQFLATPARLGQNKAQAGADELATLCPFVEVTVHPQLADPQTLPDILSGADLVVDCLDNMPSRYQAAAAAARQGITFIHGAIAGLEGFVLTIPPRGPGLAQLYGPEPSPKDQGAETLLGTPTPTPAFIATLQCAEALKVLLDRPGQLVGRAVHCDLAVPLLEEIALV